MASWDASPADRAAAVEVFRNSRRLLAEFSCCIAMPLLRFFSGNGPLFADQVFGLRFELQFVALGLVGHAERANDAKADVPRIRQVPHALRDLRVLNLPIGNREVARRAACQLRLFIPR